MNNKLAVFASTAALTVSLVSPVLVHQEARARYVQAGQDHAALCAFENDLHQRVIDSVKFLEKHPKGIPGIPASLIKNGLNNQRATLKVFSEHVQCDEKEFNVH